MNKPKEFMLPMISVSIDELPEEELVRMRKNHNWYYHVIEKSAYDKAVSGLKAARNESSWPLVKKILEDSLKELGER